MNLSFRQMIELENKSLFGFSLAPKRIKECLTPKLEKFENKYVVVHSHKYRIEKINIWGKTMYSLHFFDAEIIGYFPSLSTKDSCEFRRIGKPVEISDLAYLLSNHDYKMLRNCSSKELEVCGVFKVYLAEDKINTKFYLLRGKNTELSYFSTYPLVD